MHDQSLSPLPCFLSGRFGNAVIIYYLIFRERIIASQSSDRLPLGFPGAGIGKKLNKRRFVFSQALLVVDCYKKDINP